MKKFTLQTLLLAVFFTITLATAFSIIYYTYTTHYRVVQRFSKTLVEETSRYIYTRIDCLIKDFNDLAQIGADVAEDYLDMGPQNTPVISFFLNQLKDTEYLSSYFAGDPKGGYIIAYNLQITGPDTKNPYAPANSSYIVLSSNGSSKQTASYYDAELNLISNVDLENDYDPRERPWYTQAVDAKKLSWTDIYAYSHPTGKSGISVTVPDYDKDGNLKIVVGADLSVAVFSHFLEESELGQEGRAYIIAPNGEILFSETKKTQTTTDIGKDALSVYEKENSTSFYFYTSKYLYLGSVRIFPTSFGKNWKILVAVPKAVMFNELFEGEKLGFAVSLAVIFIAILMIVYLSYQISQPIIRLSREVDHIAELELDEETAKKSRIKEIKQIEESINSLRVALRSFVRYIPSEIAKHLMHNNHEIVLGGDLKVITIFFTDIANFTPIAEKLPIEKVNALLAAHFDALSKIILSCGGFIDKYLGDGIMSLWGAIDKIENFNPAAQSCRAALLGQVKLDEINERQKLAGMPELPTRMGINTGPVIVGNFGTDKRMNYSVLGDPVNTASRLEGLNKIYKTKIIIGEETWKQIDPHFLVRLLDIVEVKGKEEKTKIFELVAAFDKEESIRPTASQLDLCNRFTQAVHLFQQGKKEEALSIFSALAEKYPNDFPTQLYLERLKE